MRNFQLLTYESHGPLVVITLNRPEVLNALNLELFAELRWALIEAQMDDQVEIPIITGAGRAFCAGADLKSVAEHHASERARWVGAYEYADAADALFRQITQMSKVVMAMVNGPAYAAGIVLACCCDIAVASESATFCVSEGLVGIADELSTTWLQASIGLARAKMMVLTAEAISAREAKDRGLIAMVAPHEQLWTVVQDVATSVLRTAPGSRALFKQIMNDRLPVPRQRHIVESHLAAESREGAEAFEQKRTPRWVPKV
jgi:methylglutaconyl-CoA hydratase